MPAAIGDAEIADAVAVAGAVQAGGAVREADAVAAGAGRVLGRHDPGDDGAHAEQKRHDDDRPRAAGLRFRRDRDRGRRQRRRAHVRGGGEAPYGAAAENATGAGARSVRGGACDRLSSPARGPAPARGAPTGVVERALPRAAPLRARGASRSRSRSAAPGAPPSRDGRARRARAARPGTAWMSGVTSPRSTFAAIDARVVPVHRALRRRASRRASPRPRRDRSARRPCRPRRPARAPCTRPSPSACRPR